MKQWLFNPFIRVAGAKSLAVGWLIMLITAFVACYSHSYFDGVTDVHVSAATFTQHFLAAFIDWACAVAVFYVAAIIFSRSAVRFIDMAGTLALARWVMIFAAITEFAMVSTPAMDTHHITMDDVSQLITPTIVIVGMVDLVLAIWMIALMYNAFSISSNIKGGKATGVFIVAIIVAECLSKIIFHYLR